MQKKNSDNNSYLYNLAQIHISITFCKDWAHSQQLVKIRTSI